jgi:hypothetical protein
MRQGSLQEVAVPVAHPEQAETPEVTPDTVEQGAVLGVD